MDEFMKIGSQLGLEGSELRDFLEEKLAEEKEEQLRREKEDRDKRARDRELRKLELEQQLEMKKLEVQVKERATQAEPRGPSRIPKLPIFIDGKDDIDSYLRRFERFASTNKWNRTTWASNLSALLTGKALDVYSRLSDHDAID